MLRRVRTLLPLLLPLLLLQACASAPTRPDGGVPVGDFSFMKATLEHKLKKMTDSGPVVGISAAVLVDGKVVWASAAGQADAAAERAATPDTVYEVGSVSKVFTYVAVMQLVEQGLVDLDTPLDQYLPSFSLLPPLVDGQDWSLDEITVRSAMTHLSGIPSDLLHRMFSKTPYAYTDYAPMMAEVHAASRAGRFWSYSNVAVTLLGHMVEEVSGTPFPEYIGKHIYAQAGMVRSDFNPEDGLGRQMARSYEEGEEKEWLAIGEKPAGSMVSTVEDLLQFARVMLDGGVGPGGRILKPESVATHFERQNGDVVLDLDLRMGLGWFIKRLPGVGKVVSHGGATMYHRAYLALVPGRNIAVAVLSNSMEAGVRDFALEALRLATEGLTGDEPPAPEELEEVGPWAKPTGDPRVHAGLWQSPAGLLSITARGEQLDVKAAAFTFRLDPTGRGTWAPAYVLGDLIPLSFDRLARTEISFRRLDGQRVLVMEDPVRGRRMIGTKLERHPVSLAWARRVGDWVPIDGEDWVVKRAVLSRQQGRLVLTIHGEQLAVPLVLALRTLDSRRAVIDGVGRSRGDALLADTDANGVERIKTLGYTFIRRSPDSLSP